MEAAGSDVPSRGLAERSENAVADVEMTAVGSAASTEVPSREGSSALSRLSVPASDTQKELNHLYASPLWSPHIAEEELPDQLAPLNVLHELKRIEQAVRNSEGRFQAMKLPTVATPKTLFEALTTKTGEWVHLSLHAGEDILALENTCADHISDFHNAEATFMNASWLQEQLSAAGGAKCQLVFLATCFAEAHAHVLKAAGVSTVIYCKGKAKDWEIRTFSHYFYSEVARGRSIREAFEFAVKQVTGSHHMTNVYAMKGDGNLRLVPAPRPLAGTGAPGPLQLWLQQQEESKKHWPKRVPNPVGREEDMRNILVKLHENDVTVVYSKGDHGRGVTAMIRFLADHLTAPGRRFASSDGQDRLSFYRRKASVPHGLMILVVDGNTDNPNEAMELKSELQKHLKNGGKLLIGCRRREPFDDLLRELHRHKVAYVELPAMSTQKVAELFYKASGRSLTVGDLMTRQKAAWDMKNYDETLSKKDAIDLLKSLLGDFMNHRNVAGHLGKVQEAASRVEPTSKPFEGDLISLVEGCQKGMCRISTRMPRANFNKFQDDPDLQMRVELRLATFVAELMADLGVAEHDIWIAQPEWWSGSINFAINIIPVPPGTALEVQQDLEDMAESVQQALQRALKEVRGIDVVVGDTDIEGLWLHTTYAARGGDGRRQPRMVSSAQARGSTVVARTGAQEVSPAVQTSSSSSSNVVATRVKEVNSAQPGGSVVVAAPAKVEEVNSASSASGTTVVTPTRVEEVRETPAPKRAKPAASWRSDMLQITKPTPPAADDAHDLALLAKVSLPIDAYSFYSYADVAKACKNNIAITLMEETMLQKLNVPETFSDLIICGKLLRISITAAGSQKCSTSVLETTLEYQSLCHMSSTVSKHFVEKCLEAIRHHQMAHMAFQKGKPERGIGELRKCAKHAEKMGEESGKLVRKAEEVMKKATKALLEAKHDEVGKTEDREDLERDINEVKAQEAAISSTLNSLAKEVQLTIKDESKYAKEAEKQRDRAFMLNLVGTCLQTVTTAVTSIVPGAAASRALSALQSARPHEPDAAAGGHATGGLAAHLGVAKEALDKARERRRRIRATLAMLTDESERLRKGAKAETFEGKKRLEQIASEVRELKADEEKVQKTLEKLAGASNACVESLDKSEAAAVTHRRKLLALQRMQNAALSESIKKMEGMKHKLTNFEQILANLRTVVQTMGKIVTMLKSVQFFWQCVQWQCEKLAGMHEQIVGVWSLQPEDEKAAFIIIKPHFFESACGWCTLARICDKAHTACKEGEAFVDKEIMCKLPPGGEAARGVVDGMLAEMKASLKVADSRLQLEFL
eukprot:TRINITY_DN6251_c1_g1_i2.p1 TRINITY_DN6251_c1_g1~~TRINITY_DN6251_c1_g1_i2.p1  ORF type:complete len:1321 (+),score=279.88 TRINITY_DN6251_c1_g1_i2:116-4078(+)